MKKTLQELFEKNYIPEPNSGCWLWLGHMSQGITPKLSGGNARVAAFNIYEGEIDGYRPRNTCGCNICVNPDHAILVHDVDGYCVNAHDIASPGSVDALGNCKECRKEFLKLERSKRSERRKKRNAMTPCKNCGGIISETARVDRIFCSEKCFGLHRRKNHTEKFKKEKFESAKCKQCSGKIPTTRNVRAQFCSDKCKKNHRDNYMYDFYKMKRRQRRDKILEESKRKCKRCGGGIPSTRTLKAKFCCEECNVLYHRERQNNLAKIRYRNARK